MTPLALVTPLTPAAAVASVDPEHAADLQPGGGLTWCNLFVARVCAKLGAPLLGVLANEQTAWLSSESAKAAGWLEVSEAEARELATQDVLALATYYNSKGHGHIAVVVHPFAGAPTGVTYIAQAGLRNFAHRPLSHGFGDFPVRFYAFSPSLVSKEPPHA